MEVPLKSTVRRHRGRPKDQSISSRRREEILEVAVRIFARDGYRKTDLQVLADMLNVGKGTIYRYFPSKEVLFLAAVDSAMHRMKQTMDVAIAAAADPLIRIRLAARAYLEFFDEHPEVCELLIQERAEFKDRKQPIYFEHRDANVAAWQRLYGELMAAGRVRAMAPERITDVFGPLLYGTMFTSHVSGRRQTPAEQADNLVDIVFNGILSDSERCSSTLDSEQSRHQP